MNKSPAATHTWSNDPGATYPPHAHAYHKTLCCVEGSIEFKIHGKGTRKVIAMKPGSKIELPPHTLHSAVVGPRGVTCVEMHRYV